MPQSKPLIQTGSTNPASQWAPAPVTLASAALTALTAIPTPATATTTEIATKVNQIIAALKA